ncbi:hypothetical protein V5F49_09230 [Xanthobacter sp. V3C-3]|uniref:hypothetical protein n=1 Tax=Xanthobacter lutulentifluminis TaxID=3119935 RepID=UPI00372CD613
MMWSNVRSGRNRQRSFLMPSGPLSAVPSIRKPPRACAARRAGELDRQAVAAGVAAACGVAHQIDLRPIGAARRDRAAELIAPGRAHVHGLRLPRREHVEEAEAVGRGEQQLERLPFPRFQGVGDAVVAMHLALQRRRGGAGGEGHRLNAIGGDGGSACEQGSGAGEKGTVHAASIVASSQVSSTGA